MKRFLTIVIVLLISCFFTTSLTISANTSNEAATFEQFSTWILKNNTKGGELTLTNNIYITSDFTYTAGMDFPEKLMSVTIHTNGYHIYVQNNASADFDATNMYNAEENRVMFEGNGGDEGLLHVEKGATLFLRNIVFDARDGQHAVVQEDGAMLSYYDVDYQHTTNQILHGELVTSSIATITSDGYNYADTITLMEHDRLTQEDLGNTIDMNVSWNGYYESHVEMDVQWDLSNAQTPKINTMYAMIGSIQSNLKIPGLGECDTYMTLTPPIKQVIWTQHAFAIVEAELNSLENGYLVNLFLSFQGEPSNAKIMIYSDNEEWVEFESIPDEDLPWMSYNFFTDDISFHYCVEVMYEGKYYSSNVVSLKNGKFEPNEDIEGSRGGIVTITPPNHGLGSSNDKETDKDYQETMPPKDTTQKEQEEVVEINTITQPYIDTIKDHEITYMVAKRTNDITQDSSDTTHGVMRINEEEGSAISKEKSEDEVSYSSSLIIGIGCMVGVSILVIAMYYHSHKGKD